MATVIVICLLVVHATVLRFIVLTAGRMVVQIVMIVVVVVEGRQTRRTVQTLRGRVLVGL